MKKSASPAGATRIRPSAPTPRWRSQIAAMSPASSESRSSTSSIRTKSFPVPLYFPNLISSIPQVLQVFRELVHELDGPVLAGVEPSYPGVAPKPRHLAPGQRPRAPCGARDRVLQRDRSLEMPGRLSVPDGLPRGQGRTHAAVEERADLLEHPAVELRPDPCLDPVSKDLRGHGHAGRPDALLRIAIPRLGELGERPAGHGGDLEGSHGAPDVRRFDLRGCHRIERLETAVQRARTLPLRVGLEGPARGRIGAREVELVDH